MFESLFSNVVGLGILLYFGLAIYMKMKGLTLTDVIFEIRQGFRK